MIRIPMQKLPNQTFSIVLGGQNCVINLRQNGGRMYATLTANDAKVCDGHACLNAEPIPVWGTTRFSGKLFFIDTTGKEHPAYEGLGDRFELLYVTDEEWRELTA